MIRSSYQLTSKICRRTIAPIAMALLGVVRPGTWVFGGDSAGGRAP
ncbi:MAG TPA: hypothetical protein VJ812_07990 [Gemmatimonadaceae bacterium]|nr:hypothetical protein [Gemmatimonadaceae bacterium]